MKIIVLNGGPMTGKDTMASSIQSQSVCEGFIGKLGSNETFEITEMKQPLIDVACRTSGVSKQIWDAHYTRAYKEKPNPYLIVNGDRVSPRNWLIHMSENVLKPMFGKDVFGLMKAKELDRICQQYVKGDEPNFVLPDGGFIEEIQPLIDFCGPENFFLARIHREGYDFTGDSRSYLYLPEGMGHQADFTNVQGSPSTCAYQILKFVEENTPQQSYDRL